MRHRLRTRNAVMDSVLSELPRVSKPLDVTDEDLFPNIAEAARYARERGLT